MSYHTHSEECGWADYKMPISPEQPEFMPLTSKEPGWPALTGSEWSKWGGPPSLAPCLASHQPAISLQSGPRTLPPAASALKPVLMVCTSIPAAGSSTRS
eukprot:2032642-Amphidinium_carterae.2